MTEIARYTDTTAVSPVPTALVDWAQAAHAAHTLATSLCQTTFCPTSFRGKPGEAPAAILAGSEVGLSPMAALNAYDVIQGRPAPKAITLRAIAQAHGHDMWPVEMNATKCVMSGRRKGSDQTVTVEWTTQRAKQMGLADKPNWKLQPSAMLVARATSELARLIAADVLLGIPYSAEELRDQDPDQPVRQRVTVAEVTGEAPETTDAPAPIEGEQPLWDEAAAGEDDVDPTLDPAFGTDEAKS